MFFPLKGGKKKLGRRQHSFAGPGAIWRTTIWAIGSNKYKVHSDGRFLNITAFPCSSENTVYAKIYLATQLTLNVSHWSHQDQPILEEKWVGTKQWVSALSRPHQLPTCLNPSSSCSLENSTSRQPEPTKVPYLPPSRTWGSKMFPKSVESKLPNFAKNVCKV